MGRVRAASGAELLDHELLGLLFFVFAGRVITPFAAITRQTYQISHRMRCLSIYLPLSYGRPLRCRILQAHDGIRTRDLFLTKEVLYRLSYMGPIFISCLASAAALGVTWHDAALWSGKRDSNPRPRAWKARALPTELFPPTQAPKPTPGDHWWRGEDSNLRRHKPADLQSAPFGHSGTSPLRKHSRT